jgi:hypothetical protein
MPRNPIFLQVWMTALVPFLGRAGIAAGQATPPPREVSVWASTERTNAMQLSRVTEFGAWGADQVKVERVPFGLPGVVAWHAGVGTMDYLVLQAGSALYRGAGFAFADFRGIDSLLQQSHVCAPVIARAACLAAVLNSVGGVGDLTTFQLHTTVPATVDWSHTRPRDWPVDTVFMHGQDTSVVLTRFVRDMTTYDQGWVASCYSFTFREGRLLAWSMRRESV